MPVSTIERLTAAVGDLIWHGDERLASTMKLSCFTDIALYNSKETILAHRFEPWLVSRGGLG